MVKGLIFQNLVDKKRGGKGVIALNTSTRNGKMVAAVQVLDGDEVMLIGNKGTMIRTKVDQISVIGRNTQGVKVVTTREAEMLVDAVGFKESLDEGDKLIGTIITDGKDEVCLASETGKAIRFKESDVRAMGRSTRGVKGMNIGKNDRVISMIKVIPDAKLLTLSENGYGKRTNISEFSGQKKRW